MIQHQKLQELEGFSFARKIRNQQVNNMEKINYLMWSPIYIAIQEKKPVENRMNMSLQQNKT